MRILIHGINFTPELTGIGKYSGEMAEWLVARGHEVRVVTAPPYYPQWRVGAGYSGARYKREFATASEAHASRDLAPAAADGSGRIAASAMPPDGTTSHSTDEITSQSTKPPKYGGKVAGYKPASWQVAGYRNDGMVVYRCPLWVPAKPSGLKRLLHLASFALSSFPVMLLQIFWKPDVVIAIEPPLMSAPAALLVARLCGARAWLHVQDFEVDAAFDLGILQSRLLRKSVLSIERWLMRRFDRVSTISPKMLEKLLGKGVAAGKVLLFPNWVEINQGQGASVKGQGDAAGYQEELGISADALVALYSGNMGGKQGLEILAKAARLFAEYPSPQPSDKTTGRTTTHPTRQPEDGCLVVGYSHSTMPLKGSGQVAGYPPMGEGGGVVFVFCGNGAGRADLVARCEGLPNVRFMDLQPQARLSELLAFADIHLLPQRADAADLVMPSKLTGMLASGRPVVATAHANTELANVVSGCGLVVEPEQPQAFADAINTLARDAALRDRLGRAGRAYAEKNLDRDVVLAKFEQDLLACVR